MTFPEKLILWIESARIRNFILVVILINAIVLGLETSDAVMSGFGPVILAIDAICLAIFVVEILAKLMGIIFYIGAVIATKLFGDAFPEWFGDLGRSGYTLFQVMTLESWSMGIVRPVMETYPFAWAFFVPFIMVTTFAVVNLLVGLIVNSMQDAHAEEGNAATDAYRDEVMAKLNAIEARLDKQER